MKTLIVSDTHGRENNLLEAFEKEKPIDKIIHLGDLNGLEDYIENITDCVCFAVRGNNDFRSSLPNESIIMMGKHRAFITHGHYYGVEFGTKDLVRHARSLDCDTVMYGHTHRPVIDIDDNIIAINPGSLSYPRQENKRPSYILMEIDRFGEAHFTLNYL